MDPAEMLDFRRVVTVPRANQGLTFFFKRGDSKPRHQVAEIARLLIGIARHWLKLPEEDLRRLRTMASKVTAPKRGMTDRNRDRLRPLQNDQTLQRVLNLPEALCREVDQQARKLGAANVALARQWQTALLIELLLVVPMRLANLAGLRLDTHLMRLPRGGDSFLLLGESETKNRQPLDARLPASTAQMLDRYLAVYRLLLLGEPASDWLFPGRTAGSRKSHDALRQQITGTLAERCGVAMHPHLFRHLAGMMILRDNPAAHGQVQRVLGHKQLSSTMSFYTGMETTGAVEHYQDTLLARRQAGPSALRSRR
jgi:integrase